MIYTLSRLTSCNRILQASKKSKPNLATPASEEISYCLGALASLFTNLASETPARIRLMAKFVESNYEKVDRLLEVRESALARLKATEGEIEAEKQVSLDLSSSFLQNRKDW